MPKGGVISWIFFINSQSILADYPAFAITFLMSKEMSFLFCKLSLALITILQQNLNFMDFVVL